MENGIVVILAIVATVTSQSDETIRGYDCSDAKTIRRSKLSQVLPSCGKDDTNINIQTIEATLLNKNPVIKPIVIRHCNVIHNLSTSRSFVAGILHPRRTEILGRTTCLDAHATRTLSLHGQRIRGLTTHNTVHQRLSIDADPACSLLGGTFECEKTWRDYQIDLTTSIQQVHLDENKVRFENGMTCNYSDFGCVDQRYGEFYWNFVEASEDRCQIGNFKPIFNGKFDIVTSKPYVSEYLVRYAESLIGDYRFAAKITGIVDICSQTAYQTEYKNVVILVNDLESRGISDDEVTTFLNEGILYNGTRAEKRCEIERRSFVARIRELNENPNKFTQDFEAGVIVSVSQDETVLVKRCNSVTVSLRMTDDHFEEIPVEDTLGRKWFLTPLSRILINYADPIVNETWIDRLLAFIQAKHVDAFSIGLVTLRVWGFAVIFRVSKLFIKGIHNVSPLVTPRPTENRQRRTVLRWLLYVLDSF